MLGEVLRTERERRHLTIQDIEQATSIRAVYIESIENGDYNKLPGDVYTKGFIKSYANFLNLNGEALVKQFVSERNPEAVIPDEVEDKNIETEEKVSKIKITDLPETNMKLPKRKRRDDSESAGSSNSGGSFKLIAAVVLIAALAAGAWTYFSGMSADFADFNSKPKQEQTVDKPEAVAQNETNSANENTVQAAAVQNGVNLQAKFKGECWTQVIVDGALVYEDTAIAGQTLNWQGQNSVIIRVGNAGVVEFINNGKNLGTAGSYGEVTERTFTRS